MNAPRLRDRITKPDKIVVYRTRDRGPGLWWLDCPCCGEESLSYGVSTSFTHATAMSEVSDHGPGRCTE